MCRISRLIAPQTNFRPAIHEHKSQSVASETSLRPEIHEQKSQSIAARPGDKNIAKRWGCQLCLTKNDIKFKICCICTLPAHTSLPIYQDDIIPCLKIQQYFDCPPAVKWFFML